MWGLIPAAGKGTRIQPLAFSKELLPLGEHCDDGFERPRAVSEYLIERMLLAGVTKLCFVIAPGKTDIVSYYGKRIDGADICYVVQPEPAGLCDALFQAKFLFEPNEPWIVGLPDTIWFPADALKHLPSDPLSFLLFPVEHPQFFDSVVTDLSGSVKRIAVKSENPETEWIWGAFKVQGWAFLELYELWQNRKPRDEYWGTLVNEYLRRGGSASAVRAGEVYVDIGTVQGYKEGLLAVGTHAVHR